MHMLTVHTNYYYYGHCIYNKSFIFICDMFVKKMSGERFVADLLLKKFCKNLHNFVSSSILKREVIISHAAAQKLKYHDHGYIMINICKYLPSLQQNITFFY